MRDGALLTPLERAHQQQSEFGEPDAVRPRMSSAKNPGPYGTRLTKTKPTNHDCYFCAGLYVMTHQHESASDWNSVFVALDPHAVERAMDEEQSEGE